MLAMNFTLNPGETQVQALKRFLEQRFGITLPKDVILIEHQGVIRVLNKEVMQLPGKGFAGFVAGKISNGWIEVKNEFFQLFGKHAKHNVINLTLEQGKAFVEQPFIPINLSDGYYIVKMGRHVLGIGLVVDKRLYSRFVGKGRKRVNNVIEL